MPDRAAQFTALRARIRAVEGIADAGIHGVLPFRLAALDAALPGGGLPLGCLHDIAADAGMTRQGDGNDRNAGGNGDNDGAATGFAAVLAARLAARAAATGGSGTLLWLTRENTLYPPGLMRFGLTPDRLIVARAGTPYLPSISSPVGVATSTRQPSSRIR